MDLSSTFATSAMISVGMKVAFAEMEERTATPKLMA